jgi:pimeloyl-ACP methyl ester carboxylesterase
MLSLHRSPANTAPPFEERWWSSDDSLRLYARDYAGAGGGIHLPVVCLHGLTRNSADFEGVAPYIAATGRRVIVPDIRGRGLSDYDTDPKNYHLWTYAKDVLDLCDGLGIARAIFIGTSMGGLTTMVLSTLRPALIKAAVLNDVGPVLSARGLTRIAGYAGKNRSEIKSWHEAADYARLHNEVAFPDYGHKDWMAFARRLFREGDDGLRLAYDPAITIPVSAPTSPAVYDMMPLYMSLSTGRPLLLVRGALSDLIEDHEVKVMQGISPDLKRVDVEGVGHAPMLTEASSKAAVLEFLQDLP